MKQGMGNMGTWIGEHGKEREVNSNGEKKTPKISKGRYNETKEHIRTKVFIQNDQKNLKISSEIPYENNLGS